MTPKEKAKDLLNKYLNYINNYDYVKERDIIRTKKCALIAVDEIMLVACDESDFDETMTKHWWQEVKQEIENI
jgi:hypothetical protein